MDSAIIVNAVAVGPLQTNCYIVTCALTRQALIIDPGDQVEKIKAVIIKNNAEPRAIVLTHGHYDHIGCLDDFDLPVYIHPDDSPMLADPEKNLSARFGQGLRFSPAIRLVNDGDVINIGELRFQVIHTPGHSPGGICLLSGDMLFSGDTLFCHGVGRTDLAGGCLEALQESICNKLFSLSDEVKVYPGHGPETTISREKQGHGFV